MLKRLLLLLCAVGLFGFMAATPFWLSADEMGERYASMEAEFIDVKHDNRQLHRQVEELQRFIEYFRADARFREKVAKEELGVIGPDEVVYYLRPQPDADGGDN